MARLPNLVAALAEHDRRGKPTIAHIARVVRDDDLIASRTRGVGASVMTMADAATLLMGVIGDSSPGGAAAAVKSLRELRPLPWDDHDRRRQEDLSAPLQFLKGRRGFAETLTLLIEHAPQLNDWAKQFNVSATGRPAVGLSVKEASLERGAKKFQAAGVAGLPAYDRAVRIISYVPGVAAEIHLGMPWDQIEDDDSFHEYYCHPNLWSDGAAVTDSLCTMEVGLPSLLALHKAVQGF